MSTLGFLRDGIGCWAEVRTRRAEAFRGKPALFLDRDGVVIEEKNYLGDPAGVALMPDVAETIAAANAMTCAVIVVTNQSGIARGYFDWAAFERVMDRIHHDLAASGATIDGVYACAYHERGSGALGVADHPWRKPNAGMLQAAAADFGIDLTRSLLVGDKVDDLIAASTARLRSGLLYAKAYGADAAEQEKARALATHTFNVAIVDRLTPDNLDGLG